MGTLDEYRRKRDFGKTPEPAGGAADEARELRYVVQKHSASHLHWDFRIELDGVLLSWAVPKGPSLDPGDKRLAMHVEDHPLEYGSFEGVIPKGEYGGGTVMLWDRGTWRPDHGDPREHLAEGHLKFDLFGERLRGRWMLVRTKGYGGSKRDSWLLFKEHDDQERPRPEFDATAEWMTSVASGRTMEQIAADGDAVWHSDESVGENSQRLGIGEPAARDADAATASPRPAAPDAAGTPGAKRGPIPKSLDVELCTLVKQTPEGDRWLHEIKFDGYRIVAFRDGDHVRLISRNGKDWTARFQTIADELAGLHAEQFVFDGEVVVMRPDGTNDFQALQNFARRGQAAELHYMVFDLLYLDGLDLRDAALEQRKRLLAALLLPPRPGVAAGEGGAHVRYTDHIEGHGDVFFARSCEYSLEGVVSKRRDRPYRGGRGRDWVKTKCLLEQEFVIVGYTDPGGSRKAFGSLVIGVHDDGVLKQVGKVGTGFSEESLADIHARLGKLERKTPPVSNPPKGAEASRIHWVDPDLVCEVAFTEWTDDGNLRHPSFLGLREDKKAADVIAEKPVDLPEAAVPVDAQPSAGETTVAGVRLTHPDRVLWPDVGVTKLELCRYYESVAALMLPHVENRPLSLVRCPQGYTGECFYQKHVEHFPKAVATVGVYEPEERATVPYAKITGLASIIGLVQMGVLEMHPWGAKADDIDKPDRLVFDLDPDTELEWRVVTTTALLLRSELRRLGLESWLKTTGGKGLHVVVPVERRQNWAEAREFSRAFVDSIVRLEPRLFTANMSKAQRSGKIFIDYVRNTRGATAIAAYGARARPGAPVSVPLFWEEAEGATGRPEFTVRNLSSRLDSLHGDPWADLAQARQSITKKMRSQLGL